jgi:hypothetical protein
MVRSSRWMLLPRFIAAVKEDGLTRPAPKKTTTPPRDATGWWILKNGVCGATISRSAWGARVVFLLWRLRLPRGRSIRARRDLRSSRNICWAWPGRVIRARRWLSRPRDAIDLVRLTVDVGCAAICWRGRTCPGVARSFLGVELVGHVVAGASAPASRYVTMARLHPMNSHMRAHRIIRRRCR